MREPDTIKIRASSFGGLFDCALRWEAIHLLGLASWSSPRALIGSGVHAGTGAFDQARIDGTPMRYSTAVDAAIAEIDTRIANEPVRWFRDEPNRNQVEQLATRLTLTYCEHVSPRYDFESVELATTPLDIDVGDGLTIQLTGTLDRARTILVPGISLRRRLGDLKTGRNAVNKAGRANTKKHKAQVGTYELLYEHTTKHTLDRTSEIIGLNTEGDFRYGTGEITNARGLLLGYADAPGLIALAATMFKSGLFPPNPQSALCGKKYCPRHPTCPYASDEE